ncbi:hypothetical protein ACFVGN_34280, partial [Streptomyces sp. NPDC057757]|uniref:hypothetical protein n=1 Tax=Streptomyces sp. NPDC057757 TaxID=3346241 RepID=UPI0036A60E03
ALTRTKLSVSLGATQTKPDDLSTPQDSIDYLKALSFADGAGVGAANLLFHDTRTLAASGTENLDLAGVLSDKFGQALTFARIKAVLVVAAAGNTNNVNVTQPAANGLPGMFLAAADGVAVHPGGVFLWVAPSAAGAVVTPATGDLITVTNSAAGTSVTYDVLILGAAT